jgi:hypothetical protein
VVYERIVDPLLAAIKRELGAIVAKIHAPNDGRTTGPMEMGGSSAYVKELIEKLNFIKKDIFARFSIEDMTREWYVPSHRTLSASNYTIQVRLHRSLRDEHFRLAFFDRQTPG